MFRICYLQQWNKLPDLWAEETLSELFALRPIAGNATNADVTPDIPAPSKGVDRRQDGKREPGAHADRFPP